jgi:cytidylate kinase
MPHVIAIDGPAGAGKSTIARALAEKLGYVYIDTGAMYRAVGLWAIRENISPDDAHKVEQLALAADIQMPSAGLLLLNNEDVSEAIRAPEVAAAASRVAIIGGVRSALVARQRRMAARTLSWKGAISERLSSRTRGSKFFSTPTRPNGCAVAPEISRSFLRSVSPRRSRSATSAIAAGRSRHLCRRRMRFISIPQASRRMKWLRRY